MCAQKVPQVVEQERSPTRDPPQSVSSNMSPRIGNGGGLLNAANDTEDVPHRPDVCVTDAPREDSGAREQRQRLVVQVHRQYFAPRHSSQPELQAAAHHDGQHQALLGVELKTATRWHKSAAFCQHRTTRSMARTQLNIGAIVDNPCVLLA